MLTSATERETILLFAARKILHPVNIVPLAKAGAIIPGGYTIKSSVLRGEKSDGMLCSEAELEIGDDESGIMHCHADLSLGSPLETALNIEDTVFRCKRYAQSLRLFEHDRNGAGSGRYYRIKN